MQVSTAKVGGASAGVTRVRSDRGDGMDRVIVLLMAVLGTAADVPQIDGVHVTQSVVHYAIAGTSLRQVGEELETLGPADPVTGRRMAGYVTTGVYYNYQTDGVGEGRCVMARKEVRLEIRIDMPDWRPVREPSARLRAQWTTFHARLLEHELGHRVIGVDGAIAVRDALASMPEMACDAVRGWLRREVDPHIVRMAQAHRLYDRDTRHGQTQGVVWER